MNLTNDTSERFAELEELKTAVADLGGVRRRFRKTGKRYVAGKAPIADLEIVAVEVLRCLQVVERSMRCSLLAIKLLFSGLWSRGGGGTADADVWAAWTLRQGFERLAPLLELGEKNCEGRSSDGRVTVGVDRHMRVVDLGFDPDLMMDPAYKASFIEAVNAAIQPVYQWQGAKDALMAELPPPDSDFRNEEKEYVVEEVLEELWRLGRVQEQLAEVLPLIPRGEKAPQMTEHIAEVARSTQAREKGVRRHFKRLNRYRTLLLAKTRLLDVTPEDLVEVGELKVLFGDELLDDVDDLADSAAGAAGRALIAGVTAELRLRAKKDLTLLRWQRFAMHRRHRLALIEAKTYEARSPDDAVTARVAGSVQLVDLIINADGEAEPEHVKASVIKAINSGFETVTNQRQYSPFEMVLGDLLG